MKTVTVRWLIAAVIIVLGLIFGIQYRMQSDALKIPNESVINPVVSDSEAKPEEKSPFDSHLADEGPDPEIIIEKKLEASKPILQEKELLKRELAIDPHGTPAALMQAGQALGEISELEAKYPERKEEFVRYYKECFESEKTMTVTRVQCLRRYFKSAGVPETEVQSVIAGLPAPVQRLYKKTQSVE